MEEQRIVNNIGRKPLFSLVEIDAAIELAKAIDPDEPQEIDTVGQYTEHKQFGPDTHAHALRGKNFYECGFVGLSVSGTNVSNIIMKNCSLERCKIVNSNLKCSDFSGSKLHLSGISSSFDSSDFSHTTICNSHLEGCSFSESFFCRTKIQNSTFLSSEFASSIFLQSSIENVDMSQSNLEYSEFEQTVFTNVMIPYWGVLHVTKGFSEVLLAPDIWFVTPDGTHRVNNNQYIEEISLLRPYFYYKKDFLALANLYIFEGENTDAYHAVLCGLEHAINIGSLKLLRNLCRIASLNSFFSKNQMRELYQRIEVALANTCLTAMQYKNYSQELDLARHFLIDCPFDQDSISITVRTSIPATNYQKLSMMINTLDTVIAETAPTAISHMEVRHNSPIEIVVQASGFLWQLLAVFAALELVFDKTISYIEKIQNIVLNQQKLHKAKEDAETIKQLERQIAEMKETIRKVEEHPSLKNTSLILVDSDEIRCMSYILSAKQIPIEELRTFNITRPT